MAQIVGASLKSGSVNSLPQRFFSFFLDESFIDIKHLIYKISDSIS